MNIKKSLSVGLILVLCSLSSCDKGNRYIAIQGYAQGGTYTVKLNLNGRDGFVKMKPEAIKEAIDSILNDIDTTLSDYNKGSMLSRFSKGETIRPNELFCRTYIDSYRYYEETLGALDCAAAPIFELWSKDYSSEQLPSDQYVQNLRRSTGMKRLVRDIEKVIAPDGTLDPLMMLNDSTKKAEADPVVPQMNYNAFAQGLSCDLVASFLRGIGVKDMLVDIGEITCDGVNPNGKPWTVGVDRPVDGNNAPGKDLDGIWQSSGGPCGIVTSGNYRKFFIKDGKKYAHIVDPRTGYPVNRNLLSATIVSPSGEYSDAISTYCMVIGLEAAKEFISSSASLEGYLIYDDNGKMEEWASAGFHLVE